MEGKGLVGRTCAASSGVWLWGLALPWEIQPERLGHALEGAAPREGAVTEAVMTFTDWANACVCHESGVGHTGGSQSRQLQGRLARSPPEIPVVCGPDPWESSCRSWSWSDPLEGRWACQSDV